MNHETIYTPFNITSVCRADLENIGFDASEVDDGTMTELASKLADDYCEQLFWGSLEILAEALNLPRRRSPCQDEEPSITARQKSAGTE